MQVKSFKKLKEAHRTIQKKRKHLLKILLQESDIMMGSYTESLVRCGRSLCHCRKKPAHPVTRFLTYDSDGKRVTQLIRKKDRSNVETRWVRHKECRKALLNLEDLNQKELDVIKRLLKTRHFRYR